jgi:hypothetical protein
MAKPGKMLDMLLNMLDQDIKKHRRIARRTSIADPIRPQDLPFSKDTAATLCKYASTLDDIIKVKDKDKEKTSKELSKLSTEQLIELYQKEKK